MNQLFETDLDIDMADINSEELHAIIRKLKNNKSCGADENTSRNLEMHQSIGKCITPFDDYLQSILASKLYPAFMAQS